MTRLKQSLLYLYLLAFGAASAAQEVSHGIDATTTTTITTNSHATTQEAFIAKVAASQNIDVCDTTALAKHYGTWLIEMIDLVALPHRSPKQNQQLQELYSTSQGFMPILTAPRGKRYSHGRCMLEFGAENVPELAAMPRKFPEAIKYDLMAKHINMCPHEPREITSHNIISETFTNCNKNENSEMVLHFINRSLFTIYIFQLR